MSVLSICSNDELNQIIDNSKEMYYICLANENDNVITAGDKVNIKFNR